VKHRLITFTNVTDKSDPDISGQNPSALSRTALIINNLHPDTLRGVRYRKMKAVLN
jgi:high-affinity K+ transport system ATPase subunit B